MNPQTAAHLDEMHARLSRASDLLLPVPDGYRLTVEAAPTATPEMLAEAKRIRARLTFIGEQSIFARVQGAMLPFFGKPVPGVCLSDIEVFRGTFADSSPLRSVNSFQHVIGCGFQGKTARVILSDVTDILRHEWPSGVKLSPDEATAVTAFLIDKFRDRFNSRSCTDDRFFDRRTGEELT